MSFTLARSSGTTPLPSSTPPSVASADICLERFQFPSTCMPEASSSRARACSSQAREGSKKMDAGQVWPGSSPRWMAEMLTVVKSALKAMACARSTGKPCLESPASMAARKLLSRVLKLRMKKWLLKALDGVSRVPGSSSGSCW